MRHHYVYYSYEDFGRGYIGSRTCDCPPEEDNYFGSFYDKTFTPTNKIILETFDNREEALDAEIKLHQFYDVAKNPHFANQAKQTSTKFIVEYTEEQRKQIGNKFRGKKLSPEHIQKVANANRGKKRTEEQKQRMREAQKNRNYVPSEEARKKMSEARKGSKNHNYGKPLSEETKRKLRESQIGEKSHSYGKKLSEETKKKISEKLMG